MKIIDFHSHILPEIDDGSKSLEMSLEMLKMSGEQGVSEIVATPHFYPHRDRIDHFLKRRERAYERLLEAQQCWPSTQSSLSSMSPLLPKVIKGAEVTFFPGMYRADNLDELAIEGTNLFLLELPFDVWTKQQIREVEAFVEESEMTVILAHLERYTTITGNSKAIEQLLEMPIIPQINASRIYQSRGGSFLSRLRERPERKLVSKLVEKERLFLLGSDCHNTDRRAPNLGTGRKTLASRFGEDLLTRMDEEAETLFNI